MSVAWADVWAEHRGNVGYNSETPMTPYHNPWSEEMGIGDVEFCAAAATIIPHHHGVEWWPEAQFGNVGYAYCPYLEQGAKDHGVWQYDLASQGQPADLHPGDLVLYSWGNNGVADHVETVVTTYADLSFDTVGYDTGTPNGCHYPIRRDRTYLLGVVHMSEWAYGPAAPAKPPGDPTLPLSADDLTKITTIAQEQAQQAIAAAAAPGGSIANSVGAGVDNVNIHVAIALNTMAAMMGYQPPYPDQPARALVKKP